MRRAVVLLGACGLSGGCESPCATNNEVIVARYRECGVPAPDSLRDGGRSFLGLRCGASAEEGECVRRCWTQATCDEIAGDQASITQCSNDCYAPCSTSGPFGREVECSPAVDTAIEGDVM